MVWFITSIIDSLTKIGVNLSGTQLELLKWRLSPEAQKLYTIEQTNKFCKAVEKGNTDIIDVLRKEKQMKIKEMKNKLNSFFSIWIPIVGLCGLFIAGCMNTNIDPQIEYDSSFVLDTERTYSFKNQEIDCLGKGTVKFNDIWFIVNKDFIKEHFENQNELLVSLQNQNKLKKERNLCIGMAFFFLAVCILFKLK